MTEMDKPKILFISHVFPFPRSSGQRQRVYYMLRAAAAYFHVTLLTYSPSGKEKKLEYELDGICEEVIWLKNRFDEHKKISKAYYKLRASLYSFLTGLKTSNYYIGKLEFTEKRIIVALGDRTFDIVIYEYFHAWESVSYFKKRNIPVILDTHNILWQSVSSQSKGNNVLQNLLKGYKLNKYKKVEEAIWAMFDEVIAINVSEQKYIQSKVPATVKVPLVCMGIDVSAWPYSWQSARPVRLAYYGGLGSPNNVKSALVCACEIMPEIWKKFPGVELWLIGSSPAEAIKKLESDKIHVTGFIEDVAPVIGSVSIMLCPWEGTFGFRSRIVEVMALGVPVVASRNAVDGMDMEDGKGIFLTDNTEQMIEQSTRLLQDKPLLEIQSKIARDKAISQYSFEATYLKGFERIYDSIEHRKVVKP